MRIAAAMPFAIVCFAISAGAQTGDSLWTIRGGEYAGREVRIDVSLATRRGAAFLRLSKIRGDGRFVGWNPSRLPVRVAFRRSVSADDSAAFWSILDRMEIDLGMHLFEPSNLEPGADPDDVIIVDTKFMYADDGRTLVTWSNNAGVYDARVYFRSPAVMHSSRIVAHEMMHALGFGHTSQWNSIMNSGSGAPAALTVEDVAYAQYAFELRSANEREDMWERLALAADRESMSSPRAYSPCRSSPFNVLAAISGCDADGQPGGGAIGASGTSH